LTTSENAFNFRSDFCHDNFRELAQRYLACPARKGCFHVRTQQIEEQSSRYGDPDSTLDNTSFENIDQVSQGLRCNDRNGQTPAPKTTFEPTDPSDGEGDSEQQKWNSDYLSVRREFSESAWIESPHSIKSGATPH
jgi:hypothetical protein